MEYPPPSKGKWFVYAIECENGSVYIGQTADLAKRWKRHASGQGARWTKLHPPVQVFYYEEASSFKDAWHRERDLKKHHRHWLKKILREQKEKESPPVSRKKRSPIKPRRKPRRVLRRKKVKGVKL